MTPAASKRDLLIAAAALLFHHHGYGATSLADIAQRAGVPTGNVYYYFKTKEALGLASAKEQMDQQRGFLLELETKFVDPRVRIFNAIRFYEQTKDIYTRHGCPIATICSELSREDPVAKAYSKIYAAWLHWVAAQFTALGFALPQAQGHAAHLLGSLQGAAMLARTFGDSGYITAEVSRQCRRVDELRPESLPA